MNTAMHRNLWILLAGLVFGGGAAITSAGAEHTRSIEPAAVLNKTWQWQSTVTPVEKITVPQPERYTILLKTGGKAQIDLQAAERLAEIESMQSRFAEVKEMDEKIHTLERELKVVTEQVKIEEMQKEAFEKATQLIEVERDMALKQKELADERTQRYIQVLGMEGNTKVLLLVDEVGSITFTELGKSLGVPKGQATKWARDLHKLGVLEISGETVKSTLKQIDIKEGEVKVGKK